MTPSYLGNVSVATVTMALNSLQPTLLCVIILCVFLSSLYNQDVPFLDFVVLFVVVAALIVIGSHLLGMNWLAVISMRTIICILERGASVGGVSFVQISTLMIRHCCCTHNHG